MTNTVIAASFAAALAALSAGIAPSQAEPISNAYPYCLFGRGGGSTTCYFRTRAECGNGCVNNPNYVGDERARAMLAGSGLSLDAVGPKYKAKGGGKALASRSIAAPTRARASPSPGDDLAGWPASHLMNRFIVRAGWVGTLRFAHPT